MIVKHAGCKPHEYQDKTYGDKQRVANELKTTADTGQVRCTVCGELVDSKKAR